MALFAQGTVKVSSMTKRLCNLSVLIFCTMASLILAIEPLGWLINSWTDASYASWGYVYILLLIGLVIWSATSARKASHNRSNLFAISLLILSALIRLASQLLAINILGGVALAIDVYALLLLFNLHNRQRAISPFWVSVLFLFSLPVERVVQRVLGYPLQDVSAAGSCNALKLFYHDINCHGVRIAIAGQDVLVDLPCSGTASLLLSAAFFVTLSAIYRPHFITSLFWGGVTLLLSLAGNILRIILLIIGLTNQELLGFNAMLQPWHDLIGYASLGFSLAPLALFYKPTPSRCLTFDFPFHLSLPQPVKACMAGCFFLFALVTIQLPRQAVDVSKKLSPLTLPAQLLGYVNEAQALTLIEQTYFKQYGGTAQKAHYGPLGLTLVQTTSPLRHLHAPDECLRGLGFQVEFQGTSFEPQPTAIYRATSPDGKDWRVAVSFQSNLNFTTSNVSAAVWHWLKHPQSQWVGVKRITPWTMAERERSALENAVFAALDFTTLTLSNSGDKL